LGVKHASIVRAKRSTLFGGTMPNQRKTETPDERKQRLVQQMQDKKAVAMADDAAVDRMIRQNVERYGP
jgi:hypothetical protein